MICQLPRPNQVHEAEPPRIVEGNHRAGRHVEYHVVVSLDRRRHSVGTTAGWGASTDGAESSGHAEVHHQRVARR